MMRRFMAFAGDTYYANGGMADFIGSFDTFTEAVDTCKAHVVNHVPRSGSPWWHVWDMETNKIIGAAAWSNYGQPFNEHVLFEVEPVR